MRVVLGLGCDRGTSRASFAIAVDKALASIDLDRRAVVGVATIDKKNDEIGLLELARENGWTIVYFRADELASVPVPNPSATVMKYMGTPAVAEAAALLRANTDMSNLLVEKYKYRGDDGKNATVSIAKVNNE